MPKKRVITEKDRVIKRLSALTRKNCFRKNFEGAKKAAKAFAREIVPASETKLLTLCYDAIDNYKITLKDYDEALNLFLERLKYLPFSGDEIFPEFVPQIDGNHLSYPDEDTAKLVKLVQRILDTKLGNFIKSNLILRLDVDVNVNFVLSRLIQLQQILIKKLETENTGFSTLKTISKTYNASLKQFCIAHIEQYITKQCKRIALSNEIPTGYTSNPNNMPGMIVSSVNPVPRATEVSEEDSEQEYSVSPHTESDPVIPIHQNATPALYCQNHTINLDSITTASTTMTHSFGFFCSNNVMSPNGRSSVNAPQPNVLAPIETSSKETYCLPNSLILRQASSQEGQSSVNTPRPTFFTPGINTPRTLSSKSLSRVSSHEANTPRLDTPQCAISPCNPLFYFLNQ